MDSSIGIPAPVRIVNVTPALAAEWLKQNKHNRPVSPALVKRLASQMENGDWRRNGEPIVFDHDNILRDGQHRLHAIIKAGVPIELYVVFGESQADFATFDSGRMRSHGDTFACKGYSNTRAMAATARLLYCWSRTKTFVKDRAIEMVSPSTLLRFWEETYGAEYERLIPSSGSFVVRSAPFSSVWATRCLMANTSDALCVEFMNRLESGENLYAGHPVYAMRRYIENDGLKRLMQNRYTFLGPQGFASLCMKTWRAWGRGETAMRFNLTEKDLSSEIEFPNVERFIDPA